MRLIFSLGFLCLAMTAMAQKAEVVSIESKDRIFRGSINDKYPITIYLRKANTSPNIGWIESFSGWYAYDNVGTPIPITAIKSSELHIFVSQDEKLLEGLLDFEYPTTDGTARLDSHNLEEEVTKVTGLSERFQLSIGDNRVEGTWYAGDKELSTILYGNNLDIGHEKSYLKLPNGQYFDLINLGLQPYGRTAVESVANEGKNILIAYDEPANLNYGGRCGGGKNAGFIALSFDSEFGLIKVQQAVLEACYQDIYAENETEISDTVTEYEVYVPGKKPSPVYVVDRAKATITVKKQ